MTTLTQVTPLRWEQVRRGLLTAVAALLFAVGWCASLVVHVVRLVLFAAGYTASWSWAAIMVGWRAGQYGPAR